MWAGHLVAVLALGACGRVSFDAIGGGAVDDARAGDGDGALPLPLANIAFITSTEHVPGAIGGLAGADAICMARASEAKLPGTFVAWLSSSTVNAVDRIAGARGWIRTDGRMVADQPSDLAAGNLVSALGLDEHGVDVIAGPQAEPGAALTATDGGVLALSSCGDFTSTAPDSTFGTPFHTHSGWSSRMTGSCSTSAHLYCLQIDLDVTLPITPSVGRLAFVSTGNFTPASGISAADSMCTTEGAMVKPGHTFLALLPTGGMPASSRFDVTGAAWVRADGMPLAASAADLMASAAWTGLDQRADGTGVLTNVIIGSDSPEYVIAGEDCNDWSSSTAGNNWGETFGAGRTMFNETTATCATPMPVYCFEQ